MCRPPTQEKPPMLPPAAGSSGAEQPDAAMKGPAATCHRQIHLEIIPKTTKRQERTRFINKHQYNYKQLLLIISILSGDNRSERR